MTINFNLSRNRMCYIILALSITFFLSSVCTFAVLAMTHETVIKIKRTKDNGPQAEQKRIIIGLKRIEEKVKTRKGGKKSDNRK